MAGWHRARVQHWGSGPVPAVLLPDTCSGEISAWLIADARSIMVKIEDFIGGGGSSAWNTSENNIIDDAYMLPSPEGGSSNWITMLGSQVGSQCLAPRRPAPPSCTAQL